VTVAIPPPGKQPGTYRVGALIAAAGSSRRMEGRDKLLAEVSGKPLLEFAVEPFLDCDAIDQIVLVLRRELVDPWRKRAAAGGWVKVTGVVPGGERRQDSVRAGLDALKGCDWVLVHDGARPCVTQEVIRRGLQAAAETGSAVAAVPAKDTVKLVGAGQLVEATPPRERLWLVQTPQVFSWDILQAAHAAADEEATDDAALVERTGYKVKVFMGDYRNIKVTTPEDLGLAHLFLAR